MRTSPAPQTSTTPLLPPITLQGIVDRNKNEYNRYSENSPAIARLLVPKAGGVNNASTAIQFKPHDIPSSAVAPEVCHVTEIIRYPQPNGSHVFTGKYAQMEMISRPGYEISIERSHAEPRAYTFYPLSPRRDPYHREERPVFFDNHSAQRFKNTREARRTVNSTPTHVKSSGAMSIDNLDVARSTAIKYRKPDQNTVMGDNHQRKLSGRRRRRNTDPHIGPARPAVREVAEFLEEYESILSDEMQKLLRETAEAPLNGSNEGQKRAEWLHRHSHNLHDLKTNPQRADNLGAAAKTYNTLMMIVERTVQYFALNVPDSKNAINCKFKMLLDSELVDVINFEATIRVGNVKIVLTQHIDVFQTNPQHVKASDYAGLVEILHDLIKNTEPHSIQPVRDYRDNTTQPVARPTFFDALRGQDLDKETQSQPPRARHDRREVTAQAAPLTLFSALRSDDSPISNNAAINRAHFFRPSQEKKHDSQDNVHETNLGARKRR